MGAGAQLLDFSEVGVEEVIDPGEEVTSGQFDGVVGVEADLVDHLGEVFVKL